MRSGDSTILRAAVDLFRAPFARWRSTSQSESELPLANARHQSAGQRQQMRVRSGWILLAAVLLFAAIAAPHFRGLIYAADDLWAFHLPVRAFYAQCLEQGVAFDWMPQLYSGFYLTGEGQAGVYHPVHWLLYSTLPLRPAFNCELLLPYPLLFTGTFFWLRRRIGRPDAALFGALCFTFGSFSLLHFVHPNAMAIVAHLPCCLWCVELGIVAASPQKRILAAGGLALLIASQLLLGYPQYVWFCLLTIACYSMWIAEFAQQRFAWRRLLHVALFVLLGFAAGAIQLLPTYDALAQSTRQTADAAFANTGALHPSNLAQLVAPYALKTRVFGDNTHELGCYLGAVPLVLLIWLAVHWRGLPRRYRQLSVVAGVFAGLALLLCLGKSGGLYALQMKLPVVGRFRLPARYLVLFNLATSALAAIAFAGLTGRQRRNENAPQAKPRGLVGIVVASIVVSLAIFVIWRTDRAASYPLVLAGPLLIGMAVWLVWRTQARKQLAIAALVLFTAIDLGIYGLSYAIWPGTATADDVASALDRAAPGTTTGRIVVDDHGDNASPLRSGNQAVLAGARLADGYAGLEPGNILPLDNIHALRLAGVTHVANVGTNAEIAGLAEMDTPWLSVPNPLPRARLVAESVDASSAVLSPADYANLLATHDPAEVALLNESVELHGTPGSATCEIDLPGQIQVSVQATGRQLLIVNERFHPGWRVTIDDRPAEVITVYGQYLGCIVDDNSQRVAFTFQPDSVRYGKWITWAALALIVGLTLGRLPFARVKDPTKKPSPKTTT